MSPRARAISFNWHLAVAAWGGLCDSFLLFYQGLLPWLASTSSGRSTALTISTPGQGHRLQSGRLRQCLRADTRLVGRADLCLAARALSRVSLDITAPVRVSMRGQGPISCLTLLHTRMHHLLQREQ